MIVFNSCGTVVAVDLVRQEKLVDIKEREGLAVGCESLGCSELTILSRGAVRCLSLALGGDETGCY